MTVRGIIRKWYVILICALLCAGGLYFEKSQVNTVVVPSADMTYIRVVRFDNVPVFTANQTSQEIGMDKLMSMSSSLAEFESQLEGNFEMKKMNSNWKKLADSAKLKWVEKHFSVKHVGPGIYELIIRFSKADDSDMQYVKTNHESMMNAYEAHFLKTAALVTSDTSISQVKTFESIDAVKATSREGIEKKYAVIGFVLGALIGIIVVMAWDARKRWIKR